MPEIVGPARPASVAAFVHDQSAPAATWTINHNLGYRPDVSLIDSASKEFEAEVVHPTVNQTVVTLNTARAGQARLV